MDESTINYIYMLIIVILFMIVILCVKSSLYTPEKFQDMRIYDTQPYGLCLLMNILRNINSNITRKYRVTPKNIKYVRQYYSEILPIKLKDYIGRIINIILDRINKCSNTNYTILRYDTIIIKTDNIGNSQYLCDLFIYQKKNNIITKIIIELFEFKNKMIHLNSITIANGNNDYIENTSKIYGINSNYVIKPENSYLSNNSYSGTNNIRLPYKQIQNINQLPSSCYKYKNIGEIKNFNPWIYPIDSYIAKREGSKVCPCGELENTWDTYGILKNKPYMNSKLCRGGYNRGTSDWKLLPVYQPNLFK